MIVETHIIQNFAPSCLNRDDTNMPKDCEFGGFTRARISSQCLKRSIRSSNVFADNIQTAIGMRTRLIPTEVLKRLVDAGRPEEKSKEIVASFIPEVLGKINDATMKSDALVYVSEDEVTQIVDTIGANWDKLASAQAPIVDGEETKKKSKKKDPKSELRSICASLVKDCKLGKVSPDIALFGRMMAERPGLNVEGAVQVAHAISTNKVNSEIDFYTAVDDLNAGDDTGAGMMGTVAFNSACFYRYSTIDLGHLIENLGDDRITALKAVEAYIKASIVAVPSGKQNSMAAHNPPSLVLVTVRNGHPMSLTNAFVRPVLAGGSDSDMIGESIRRLDRYLSDILSTYGNDGWEFMGAVTLGGYTMEDSSVSGVKQFGSMKELFDTLREVVDAHSSAQA
jgi:CRISPR system Cascade subunit CasC